MDYYQTNDENSCMITDDCLEGKPKYLELYNRTIDLENALNELKHQNKILKLRAESSAGENLEPTKFIHSVFNRGGWLIGLLIFQSFSSFVLAANQELIKDHPSIIYFLTMLVGAGGNAGNQAAVRVIRRIALGTLSNSSIYSYLTKELTMAVTLSFLLGLTGLIRGALSSSSYPEVLAITFSLVTIVFISIVFGSILPLILFYFKIDPAHSSTSIQVIMDILGVCITCIVSNFLLDTTLGKNLLLFFGVL